MRLRCKVITKTFKGHAEIAVQRATVTAERHGFHIGITAFGVTLHAPVVIANTVIEIRVVAVTDDDSFKNGNCTFRIVHILNDGRLQ